MIALFSLSIMDRFAVGSSASFQSFAALAKLGIIHGLGKIVEEFGFITNYTIEKPES